MFVGHDESVFTPTHARQTFNFFFSFRITFTGSTLTTLVAQRAVRTPVSRPAAAVCILEADCRASSTVRRWCILAAAAAADWCRSTRHYRRQPAAAVDMRSIFTSCSSSRSNCPRGAVRFSIAPEARTAPPAATCQVPVSASPRVSASVLPRRLRL